MVVRLVPHGDLLLPDLPAQHAVHEADPAHRRRSLVLKDPTHMTQETGGGTYHGAVMIRALLSLDLIRS